MQHIFGIASRPIKVQGSTSSSGSHRDPNGDYNQVDSEVHAFRLRGSAAATGYQYACLEDASNGAVYAYSPQFCLQEIVLEYPSGTSDGTVPS